MSDATPPPLTVLLVEDDADHAFLIRRGLIDALPGVTVVQAALAAAAVGELTSGGPFDCVVCDLHLPDASNLDVLDAIVRAAPDVPVVVLTSELDESLGLAALQHGAQDYIVKGSVDSAVLARSVRFAIERGARQRAEHERSQLARQLADAQRVARLGSFDYDRTTGRVTCSPEFARLIGLSPDELPPDEGLFQVYLQRVPAGERQAVDFLLHRPMHAGSPVLFQHRIEPGPGEVRWLDCRVEIGAHDQHGRPARFVGTIQDITEQKAAEEALEHATVHDSLTGLANRALLADRLERALSRSDPAELVAVVLLDLDRFKWINDSLSHSAGDDLLVQVAEALRHGLHPTETLARFGGDEFVVLADRLKHEGGAIDVAARMAAALARPFTVSGRDVTVTASMGITVARPGDGADTEGMLRDADAAMYRAKDGGGGRYEVFDERMRAAATVRLETEQALRAGLERGEFTVHYQPIVEVGSRDVVAVEALVRWQTRNSGLLAPDRFIGVAEETGLIVDMGWRVLEQACRQVARWNRQRPAQQPLRLSVNVSPRQVSRSGFPEVVRAVLEGAGLPPSLLCLEITESLLLADDPVGYVALDALRQDGVRLSLDDFGTGYSSLAYLQRFAVDELKIDRIFVDGLIRGGEYLAIVTAIVRLAEALHLDVVAEGVSTEQQLHMLTGLGVGYAQGFGLGHPLAAADYEWLATRSAIPAQRREPQPARRVEDRL